MPVGETRLGKPVPGPPGPAFPILRGPAFDHGRLAEVLREARWDSVTAVTLPFSRFEYTEDEGSIEFTLEDSTWVCGLDDYACENTGPVQRRGRGGGGGSGAPWQAGPGQLWRNLSTDPVPSPDERLEAAIRNHNVAIRRTGDDEWTMLSHDGTEGNSYTDRSLSWSPDSRYLAVYKVIPGEPREVHYVRSSPEDQLQPEHSTLLYAKPGDRLDKEQPVIEYIYAGPHSSHVPKSFSTQRRMQAMAELGFIVAQMDGMGTSNRSKAFHDVAWRNLGDAGFPDRILWHRAAAAAHPEYDIGKVGIFGNSAGGQNAMGALLFHPEFYKVAVSTSGCHDNRMDKIWWNEQWMGWPLGPHYEASSNVVNAHKLEGRLFLLVPEMDTNVDPSSTMQVVNALIEAGKDFDFMVVPGANHGSGGDFGVRKRYDFFVRHILGVEPPAWNGLGG